MSLKEEEIGRDIIEWVQIEIDMEVDDNDPILMNHFKEGIKGKDKEDSISDIDLHNKMKMDLLSLPANLHYIHLSNFWNINRKSLL